MTLDVALDLTCILLTSVLVTAMAVKRAFNSSTAFFAYSCFDLGSDIVSLAIYHYSGFSVWYSRFFLFQIAVDCVLYFWVLAELGKNLLHSNGKLHPYWKLAIVLFAAAAVLTVTLSRWATVPSRSVLGNIWFLGLRADGALEFAGFLALVAWSGLRRLHWPEREWHIATGFGYFTFAWFLICLLLFQWSTGAMFHWLSLAMQISVLITLAYWLHYFWVVDKGLPARSEVPQLETGRDPDDSETTQCLDNA